MVEDAAVTVTGTGVLRVLGARDLPGLRALLDRDPVSHCFVASRLVTAGADAWALGGEIWGWYDDRALVSALYVGANLVPVETTPAARLAFADRARRTGRRCSSIVGPAADVLPLWELLAPAWGPAREVRACQPLMTLASAPHVPVDHEVRRVRPDELDVLLPACVAMFTEEVGVSPVEGGAGPAYRARIAELIRTGRAFARIEDGEVVFKAEIGAVSPGVAQVQGVWVTPSRRGEGLSLGGMAAVVDIVRASLAPVVQLYVNDYNTVARRSYRTVGFDDVGVFATVLF